MAISTLTLALFASVVMPSFQDSASPAKQMLMHERWKELPIITVKSTSWPTGTVIPNRYSAYGDNMSPQLSWEGVPASAVTVAIFAEDPDAHQSTPFVHWAVVNIPATVRELPEQPADTNARPAFLMGGMQGMGNSGAIGYFGMKPPENDPAHGYHFSVLAIDKTLDLPEGFSREAAIEEMKGHVVATGSFAGTYKKT